MSLVCAQFKCQTVVFDTLEKSSSSVTTPAQGGPGSDGNEGVPCIHQISSITSDCLVLYPRHSFMGSYTSAEM